jgi:hypothetical protein
MPTLMDFNYAVNVLKMLGSFTIKMDVNNLFFLSFSPDYDVLDGSLRVSIPIRCLSPNEAIISTAIYVALGNVSLVTGSGNNRKVIRWDGRAFVRVD